MQEKKTSNLEKSQSDKNIKSIKVLHSNSHADRPKISMEGNARTAASHFWEFVKSLFIKKQ